MTEWALLKEGRIEQVAEAIRQADENFPNGPYDDEVYYGALAAAVVEALQLTEEHGYQIEGENPNEPDAWFPAADYKTSRPVSHRRLVGPWVREEQP